MTLQVTPKIALLFAGLVLAGCSNIESSFGSGPVATEPDLVTTRLAQAAEKASKSLDAISSIEQVRTPLPTPDNYASAPPALTQPITVKWAGPIEQITEMLATRAGMHFRRIGNRSGATLTVNLDVYQKPLIEVLRDVGLQAGRRADISVNSVSNTIEISYAPVDGN